jgi:hypothetical protein
MQASRAFDLPCPWAPLQSMTAAASRELPNEPNVRWFCGAKVTSRFESRWEFDDNSRGVRFLPASTTRAIVVLVCLTSTVHSQGFSPSQRFDPARALWLCFAPHPPIGFVVAFRAFPSRSAVTPLGARCSLAVAAGLGSARASSSSAFPPAFECPSRLFVPRKPLAVCPCNPEGVVQHQRVQHSTEVVRERASG